VHVLQNLRSVALTHPKADSQIDGVRGPRVNGVHLLTIMVCKEDTCKEGVVPHIRHINFRHLHIQDSSNYVLRDH